MFVQCFCLYMGGVKLCPGLSQLHTALVLFSRKKFKSFEPTLMDHSTAHTNTHVVTKFQVIVITLLQKITADQSTIMATVTAKVKKSILLRIIYSKLCNKYEVWEIIMNGSLRV